MTGVFFQLANEHIRYLSCLELALVGQGELASTDCRSCDVGRWIDGGELSQILATVPSAREVFALMTLSHEHFHAAGARAFAAKDAGDIEAVQRGVTDMVLESNWLVTLLMELDQLCRLQDA